MVNVHVETGHTLSLLLSIPHPVLREGKLYFAQDSFVNYVTIAVKLRKEFKTDNPEQAERSSG
jgi:hypothetical protein